MQPFQCTFHECLVSKFAQSLYISRHHNANEPFRTKCTEQTISTSGNTTKLDLSYKDSFYLWLCGGLGRTFKLGVESLRNQQAKLMEDSVFAHSATLRRRNWNRVTYFLSKLRKESLGPFCTENQWFLILRTCILVKGPRTPIMTPKPEVQHFLSKRASC